MCLQFTTQSSIQQSLFFILHCCYSRITVSRIAADLETNLRHELPVISASPRDRFAARKQAWSNEHIAREKRNNSAAKQSNQRERSSNSVIGNKNDKAAAVRSNNARGRTKTATTTPTAAGGNQRGGNQKRDAALQKPSSRIERFSRSVRAIEDLRLRCRADVEVGNCLRCMRCLCNNSFNNSSLLLLYALPFYCCRRSSEGKHCLRI